MYTFGRFWFENMRIDPAHHIAGLRLNAWVSVLVFLLGIAWFVWLGRHERSQRRPGHAQSGEPVAPDVVT
jgi:prolipoprotein diacylglyceryltransferase